MENCEKHSKKLCAQCRHYDYCDRASRCDGQCDCCDDSECENNSKYKKTKVKTKKLDELKFLLTSVLVINQTNEHKDNDISLILDYVFRRLYGANTNLFLLACAGKTKEQIMPEVQKLLEHTQYNNYLEEYQ